MIDVHNPKERARYLRDVYECWCGDPETETMESVNDFSRAVIATFVTEHGEGWLGMINLHGDMKAELRRYDPEDSGRCPGAAFIIPCYDEDLVRMIQARHDTPYTGTANDYKLVCEIVDRIDEIGGVQLYWM